MDSKKYSCLRCGIQVTVKDKPVMTIRKGKPMYYCKACWSKRDQPLTPAETEAAKAKAAPAPVSVPAVEPETASSTAVETKPNPPPVSSSTPNEDSEKHKSDTSGASVNPTIDPNEGSTKTSVGLLRNKEKDNSSSSSDNSSDDEKKSKKKAPSKANKKESTEVVHTVKPSGICFICEQDIGGTYYTCGDLQYHEKCITCHDCKKTNRSDWKECVIYPSDDGKSINFFCPECNISRAKKCYKCEEPILDGALVVGSTEESKKHYHAKCLCCGHCGANMAKGEDLVYLNEVLTCSKCRKEKSLSCQKCKETITGGYNSIKEDSADSGKIYFHDKCFLCIFCEKNLNDVDIGGKTEHKDVYCKPCYMDKYCEKCTRCSAALIGAFFRVAGEKICKNCCKCGSCGAEITGQFRMNNDGAFQCVDENCVGNRAEE